ncbi:hypothetical protein BEN78_16820 [Xanthomonas citri pv. mangiferaeindicae]|nr:hypothetical protein BEN78_16820 [Xanthomonas citri pv. mangiferaeindicae]
MQDDVLQIRQGAASTWQGQRLGYVGADGRGGALLDVWSEAEPAWSVHHRLQPDAILPAGGRFLRVSEIRHGEPGGWIALSPASDTGAIAPVPPEHAVLPLHGSLDIGSTRLELVAPPEAKIAHVRRWPKLQPLARTPADQIEALELRAGDTLTVGNRTLRVERIQSDAGEIGAFVAFSISP